jgi:hypothetical protein
MYNVRAEGGEVVGDPGRENVEAEVRIEACGDPWGPENVASIDGWRTVAGCYD